MSEQEKAFWEIWDKIEPNFKSYNHRQMFDFGYQAAQDKLIKTLEMDICPDWTPSCCDGWCGAYQNVIKVIKELSK